MFKTYIIMDKQDTTQAIDAQNGAPAIYKALSDIMSDIDAIGKSQRNTSQNFQFRGIDDVVNNVHGVFAKHRVFVLPRVEKYDLGEKLNKSGNIVYYTRATVHFRFTSGVDGSYVETVQVGEAMDSGDKGMNKAMAVALKYALTQMLLIPTVDIPDPDASDPGPTRPVTAYDMCVNCQDPMMKSLLGMVAAAKTQDELRGIYADNAQFQKDKRFVDACNARFNELNIPTA